MSRQFSRLASLTEAPKLDELDFDFDSYAWVKQNGFIDESTIHAIEKNMQTLEELVASYNNAVKNLNFYNYEILRSV